MPSHADADANARNEELRHDVRCPIDVLCVHIFKHLKTDNKKLTEPQKIAQESPQVQLAKQASYTIPQSGLGIGPQTLLRLTPDLSFASLSPMYASRLAGLPTVTDHVRRP